MQKQTILCVDDELDNIQALERIFRAKYTVLKSTSGASALKILDEHQGDIAVIISDQRMPEMTGVQFLSQALDKRPETKRMLLTGYTDIESIVSAVNSGQIYRYLTKPWDPVDLLNTVDQATESFLMAKEIKQKNLELEAANKELQTLDQAKNQFMTLINHELKTPLTSILSFTELLQETPLSEEQEVCISRIKKSADRLRTLIQDVLLVVGGETKTLKCRPLPFEERELERAVPSDIQALILKKDQHLKFDFVTGKYIGDITLILQVLNRLIHNATKFGHEKSQILVKSHSVSSHRVRIEVENTGLPISPVIANKILKPFFIDEDVMNHSTGMGLGLTVCQAILKAHGSNLHIENSENGVRASFELACL